MKFKLEIELGNDAMQSLEDIEEALRRLGRNLRMSDPPQAGDDGNIRDLNGNTVGGWKIMRGTTKMGR